MAEHIADNRTDVAYTASEAGFLRGVVALLTYLYQSAPAVVSGIHRISYSLSAASADVHTRIAVIGIFDIPCLPLWYS